MTRVLRNTIIISLVFLVAACNRPVMNVDDQALNPPPGATGKQVGDAIRRAGAGLGWNMKATGPGKIEATLRLRTHVAVVDIAYSTKSFSISYKDSENLGYDGTNIHKNYNGWVQNLEKAIVAQVSGL